MQSVEVLRHKTQTAMLLSCKTLCINDMLNKPIRDHQTCQKSQISYFPILSYFCYVIFECLPCTKMQKAFVLHFVLGSHTV